MNDINQVDTFYDILDEACILLYDELNLDYLECLHRVCLDLTEGINDSRLSPDGLNKLEEIYAKFDDMSFSNESIREALNLLLVKGIKHSGKYPLDLISPDSISLLIGNIIKNYFSEGVSLFQTNLGLGCEINTIANFLDIDVAMSGQEEDEFLAKLAKSVANMQDNDLIVYNNKSTDPLEVNFDCLIGYLKSETNDDKFLPYEILNKYLKNLNEDGLFVVTIDNDFFNHDGLKFREQFTGTLLGLLLLPDELFKGDNKRSILIGSKVELNDYEMFVTQVPSMKNSEKFVDTINKIERWINSIRESVNDKLGL